jgi:UDP-N-acetyl-D-mannosaminuronic acid dehydrogenase
MRIIGGISPESSEKAKTLYQEIADGQIHLTDATTAELVKVMENTYRDVNIALANELAKISQQLGVSAWDVIRLANLHPRVNLHTPGPGVGGHCISVDPWFIVEQCPETAKLIYQARQINEDMPMFTANCIQHLVQDLPQANITIFGLTYKADVDDVRESPVLHILETLRQDPRLNIRVYDPHVIHKPMQDIEVDLVSLETAIRESDCLVFAVDHSEFKYLNPRQLSDVVRHKRVLDCKRILNQEEWEELGFTYALLGDGKTLPSLMPLPCKLEPNKQLLALA